MLARISIQLIPVPVEEVLIAVSMESILAASNKTLLTSVAFGAETAGLSSINFTLVAAATSYFISRDVSFYEHVQPDNEFTEDEDAKYILYIKKIEEQGILKEVTARDIMSPDQVSIPESMRIGEDGKAVQGCRKTEFPVTRRGKVIGQMNS